MTLLACENVGRSYRTARFFDHRPPKQVLAGVDLWIGEGECVALLGESGSGKSTLGRLILGLERPDTGVIRFRGKSLVDMTGTERREFRRSVQVVFQDSIGAVDPRFTILRIVEEPLRHLTGLDAGERRKRIAKLLEMVSIDPSEMTKLPGQVSGGQLQRICIARALASDPQLVVLDEAVSNLDLALQIQTLDLLSDLREKLGTAYLFITHDLRLVRRFADRVAVLKDGRIVEEIAATGRFAHPASQELAAAILPSRPRMIGCKGRLEPEI